MTRQPTSNPTGGAAAQFAETHWSLVLAARTTSPEAAAALAGLCQAYWYPLYAFVRRQGHSPHDAQDLTQEFFARLLAKNYLADVDRAKGRFRSFLLAAMKNFLANEWDRARAQKRGGGDTVLSLDATAAESRYALEPADHASADKLYDRRWALTLLDRAIGRLRDEFARDDKAALFDELKFALTGDKGDASHAAVAARLGMTEGALKVAAHRLRKRYRELLRAEIAETVATAAEVEEELQQLFAALGG